MVKRWQPTPQECELIADMLDADRPKAAIAKFLYISESTLRRWLARVRTRRHAAGSRPAREVCQNARKHLTANRGVAAIEAAKTLFFAE
jgi:transposase-like protein